MTPKTSENLADLREFMEARHEISGYEDKALKISVDALLKHHDGRRYPRGTYKRAIRLLREYQPKEEGKGRALYENAVTWLRERASTQAAYKEGV